MNPKYAAKPYKLGIQQQSFGSAVELQNRAWYFVRGPHNRLQAASFDTTFLASQDARNERAWSSGDLVPQGGAEPVLTSARPAAVATGTDLFVFWVDAAGRAIRVLAGDGTGSWSRTVSVYTPKGKSGALSFQNAQLAQSEISAYEVGGRVVLSWIQEHNLCNMLLDPAGVAADGVWTGQRIVALPLADIGLPPDRDGLSTTWITQGATRWMAVATFDVDDGSQNGAASLLSLDDDGMPRLADVLALKHFGGAQQGGISLVQPITGELRAYWVDPDGKARERILLTYEDFRNRLDEEGRVVWSSHRFVLLDPYDEKTELRAATPPAFIQALSAGRPDRDPQGTETTAYDIYGLTFYTEESDEDARRVSVVVAREGAIQVAAHAEPVPNLKGTDTPPLALSGVFDAPVPLPGQNLVAIAAGGSVTHEMLGRPLSTVEYGHTEGLTQEHSSSAYSTIGIQTEGTFTAGIGAAWEASYAAGLGRAAGESQSVVWQTSRIGETWIERSADGVIAATAPSLMLGSHLALAQQLAAFVNVDDELETVAVGGVRQSRYPLMVRLGAIPGGRGSGRFAPFSVVPGDLYSYTPDDVNRRIRSRYDDLSPEQQRAFAGAEHAYTGDYLRWLDELAVPLGQVHKYLEIITSNAGGQATSYEVSHSRFQEWWWTYDASLYAGLAVSVEFWGLKLEYTLTVGTTVSLETRTATEAHRRWGIDANVSFPGGAKPGHVTGYTTRLYLLPANVLWTKEILYLSTDKDGPLDPNGAPWRIFFVVDPLSIRFLVGEVPGQITRLEEPTPGFPYRKLGVRSPNHGGAGTARYLVHTDAVIRVNGKSAGWEELQKQDAVTIALDSTGVTQIDATR